VQQGTLIHAQKPGDRASSGGAAEETLQDDDTPSTMLEKLNQVPSTSSAAVEQVRKRSKQASILTSPKHIEKRKSIKATKLQKSNKSKQEERNTKMQEYIERKRKQETKEEKKIKQVIHGQRSP
ncbi:hypothetical protein ILUMI_14617, partial [Ignelater luminosus]